MHYKNVFFGENELKTLFPFLLNNVVRTGDQCSKINILLQRLKRYDVSKGSDATLPYALIEKKITPTICK